MYCTCVHVSCTTYVLCTPFLGSEYDRQVGRGRGRGRGRAGLKLKLRFGGKRKKEKKKKIRRVSY